MNNTTCRWAECANQNLKGRGFCRKHYLRAYRAGDFSEPWTYWKSGREGRNYCKWPECNDPVNGQSLCQKHYQRASRMGDFSTPWESWKHPFTYHGNRVTGPCAWPGCKTESECVKFCMRHYAKAVSLGNIEDPWNEVSITCTICGVEFCRVSLREEKNSYCTDKCRNRSSWVLNRARVMETNKSRLHAKRSGSKGERFSTEDLRARSGDCCYLCDSVINFSLKHPDPQSPSWDHVIPLSRGGLHEFSNVSLTHLVCNLRKGTKLITEMRIQK